MHNPAAESRNPYLWIALLLATLLGGRTAAMAQTCQSADDMDAATRSALEATAQRYFDMAAKGDTAALQQNSIPSVAASFAGIEAAVKDNQSAFAGAQAAPRPPFLLALEGNAPVSRAEFLCGVFQPSGQTSNSAVFTLNNVPPGKYGLVILDIKKAQDSRTLTLILQQMGADWKLAGFYAKLAQVDGHDGAWFVQKAREFKTKGQLHNAWLYYREAIALTTPVDFMSTLATDRLYDEAQAVQPADLPLEGKTAPLVTMAESPPNPATHRPGQEPEQYSAGKAGKTVQVTALFPLAVGNDLDLVVKYQADDVSNTAQTFQQNTAVMRALVAKYPEFRDAFAGVVARAVEPSGRDYGSLLPMKDIK